MVEAISDSKRELLCSVAGSSHSVGAILLRNCDTASAWDDLSKPSTSFVKANQITCPVCEHVISSNALRAGDIVGRKFIRHLRKHDGELDNPLKAPCTICFHFYRISKMDEHYKQEHGDVAEDFGSGTVISFTNSTRRYQSLVDSISALCPLCEESAATARCSSFHNDISLRMFVLRHFAIEHHDLEGLVPILQQEWAILSYEIGFDLEFHVIDTARLLRQCQRSAFFYTLRGLKTSHQDALVHEMMGRSTAKEDVCSEEFCICLEFDAGESITFWKWQCLLTGNSAEHSDEVIEFPSKELLKVYALKHFESCHKDFFDTEFFRYERSILQEELPCAPELYPYSPLKCSFNGEPFDTAIALVDAPGLSFPISLLSTDPENIDSERMGIPNELLGSVGLEALRQLSGDIDVSNGSQNDSQPTINSSELPSTVSNSEPSVVRNPSQPAEIFVPRSECSSRSNSAMDHSLADCTEDTIRDGDFHNGSDGEDLPLFKSLVTPKGESSDKRNIVLLSEGKPESISAMDEYSSASNASEQDVEPGETTTESDETRDHKERIWRKYLWEGPPPSPLDAVQTSQLVCLSRNECPFCNTASGSRGLRVPSFANDEIKEECMIAHIVKFHHKDPDSRWVLDAKRVKCPLPKCASAWRPSFKYPNSVTQIAHIISRHVDEKEAYDVAMKLAQTEKLLEEFPFLDVAKSFAKSSATENLLWLQCAKCDRGFHSPYELVQHAKRYHPTEEHYSGAPKCPFGCKKRLQRLRSTVSDNVLRLLHVMIVHLPQEDAVSWVRKWIRSEQALDLIEKSKSRVARVKEAVPPPVPAKTKSPKTRKHNSTSCKICSKNIIMSDKYSEAVSTFLHVLHIHLADQDAQNSLIRESVVSITYSAQCAMEFPYIDVKASVEVTASTGKPSLQCVICAFRTDTSRRISMHARHHEDLMHDLGYYPDPCSCGQQIRVCGAVKESFQRLCHVLERHSADEDQMREAIAAFETDYAVEDQILDRRRSLELSVDGETTFACPRTVPNNDKTEKKETPRKNGSWDVAGEFPFIDAVTSIKRGKLQCALCEAAFADTCPLLKHATCVHEGNFVVVFVIFHHSLFSHQKKCTEDNGGDESKPNVEVGESSTKPTQRKSVISLNPGEELRDWITRISSQAIPNEDKPLSRCSSRASRRASPIDKPETPSDDENEDDQYNSLEINESEENTRCGAETPEPSGSQYDQEKSAKDSESGDVASSGKEVGSKAPSTPQPSETGVSVSSVTGQLLSWLSKSSGTVIPPVQAQLLPHLQAESAKKQQGSVEANLRDILGNTSPGGAGAARSTTPKPLGRTLFDELPQRIVKDMKKQQIRPPVDISHIEGAKGYPCSYCPKTFATARGVREHERRSHESRLFLDAEHLVCPHCEQEFQNKRNRDEHVKRHGNPNSVIGRGF
ncbi:unnamed protein product [Nippostrongylus brasiliensis]|uniref:C2H2-type domain-containing protein n=1 Tax=Nippostrongylus brasiliensis TaxID=27835 RepID=A0A158R2X3_NIPBR|nr:unnamed protein product [Nippostrongylus brasiliensis]